MAAQTAQQKAAFTPLQGQLIMMQWLGGTDYQSDITQFLEQLKQQDSNLPARQKQGHALLWQPQLPDAAENRSLQKGFAAAHIAQQPYVYATQPLNPAKKTA